MRARRLPGGPLLAPALALLALAACHREAPAIRDDPPPPEVEAVRYRDLLLEPRKDDERGPRRTAVRRCGEESHLSIELRPGDRRVFEVDLDRPATLLVGACVEGAPLEPGQGLRMVVGGRRGRGRVETLRFEGGWKIAEVEVAPPRGGRLRVRLVANVGRGTRVFVSDLALRFLESAPPPPPASRAILISLDAFREDAIGAVSGRTRTPSLNRLLAESERFRPHWAAEISTKPSHASMLTGLPVGVHGCDRHDAPLAEAIDTIAERLGRTGVSTAGFASIAPYFNPRFGLAQGFDDYRWLSWSTHQELRAASSWATGHREDPSFLFVHLYGAHSDFRQLPYEGSGASRRMVEELFGVPDYGCRGRRCASALLLSFNFGGERPLAREAEILRFLYERGVETLDSELGKFFDELRRGGLWDDTLVILTADHGEQFGEHGYFLHTTPHEETLRVPLIVKWPGGERAGRTTDLPSTSLDLVPTLLAHFGLPADDLVGRDLARPARARPAMISENAVRLDDWKLLLGSGHAEEALFDLGRDPRETENLLAASGEIAERLRELWRNAHEEARRLLGREVSSEPRPFTDEEIEQLRSLGYLQ